jgi:quercetin dioxygenase-like cupin family protein
MTRPTLLTVDEGELLSDRPGRTVRGLLEHTLLDATWSRYEAGEDGPPPHIHREHVDAFFVVEGELEFGVGPEVDTVRAPAGTFVLVPPQVVHTFRNASGANARWLNLHAPSTGFVAYVRGDRESFDSYDPPADGGLSASAATVTDPGSGAWVDGTRSSTAVVGHAPQLSAAELVAKPGFELAPSQDPDRITSFFVLDGAVELELADRVAPGKRGTWLSALPGERHALRNPGPGDARLLSLRAPGTGK